MAAKDKEIQDLARSSSPNLSLSPERQQQMQKDIQKKGLELSKARIGAQRVQIEVSGPEQVPGTAIRVINQFGRDEGSR